jgi:hypothetical protein
MHTDVSLVVDGDKFFAPVHGRRMRRRPTCCVNRAVVAVWVISTHMIRLHMALRSLVQNSIGPRGVEAQSIERANWI